MVNAKRKVKRLLCFALSGAMCFAYGSAFAASGSIEVKKEWEHGNNPDENRPSTVEVSLVSGEKVQDTATLSSANGWVATFANVPKYDSEGKVISYTLSERKVEGYTSAIVQQPSAGGLNISGISQKVTPANEDTYEIGGATLVIAKTSHSSQKEYSYCVWTETALNEDERIELLELINKGKLQGLGKDLSMDNTMFRNGSGAVFTLGSESVTIGGLSGNHAVTFSNTKAWALFYYGALNRIAAKRGVLYNTYTQEATPSPEATAAPETTNTPEVTQTPEVTNTPEVTQTPEATTTPAVTESPEVTTTPEITVSPELSTSPEVTKTPTVTKSPTATKSPAATATPRITPTPDAVRTPAPTASPEATAEPTVQPTVSPTTSPVIGDVEETPKSGDQSVVLLVVIVIAVAAAVYFILANKDPE